MEGEGFRAAARGVAAEGRCRPSSGEGDSEESKLRSGPLRDVVTRIHVGPEEPTRLGMQPERTVSSYAMSAAFEG